jgi:hypothetical protein
MVLLMSVMLVVLVVLSMFPMLSMLSMLISSTHHSWGHERAGVMTSECWHLGTMMTMTSDLAQQRSC